MAGRSIVIVGTMDTKGDQFLYMKNRIEEFGHRAIVIDIGVVGEIPFEPDVSREKTADRAGYTIQGILDLNNRRLGLEKMAEGAAEIIKDLYLRDELEGVLAGGGSQGTSLSLQIMKSVPIGIPKLVLSTVAYSGCITPDMIGGDDLMMLPWVGGLWGLNSISSHMIDIAAGAITGAAGVYNKKEPALKKVVGVSSLGGAVNRYMNDLKPALENRGYEVAVFHVTGMSGRAYERAIDEGLINISLDLSAGVELLNHVVDGVCTAGPDRLEAACRKGIPQIVSPGAIEAFMWGHDRPIPEKFAKRPGNWHSALWRTTVSGSEEMGEVGTIMAAKLNKATGPVAVVVPMLGFVDLHEVEKMIVRTGEVTPLDELRRAMGRVSSPGLNAYYENLVKKLKPEIHVFKLDAGMNDQVYTDKILELFDEMVREG